MVFALLLIISISSNILASTDSIAYFNIRQDQISSNTSSLELIEAADALAELRLFEEAITLLKSNVDNAPSSAFYKSNVEKKRKWYLSSGMDYYHLEDVDTSTMTIEELRDYNKLTETPLSYWFRAKTNFNAVKNSQSVISPDVYISNIKSRLSINGNIPIVGDNLVFETLLKTEKWYPLNTEKSLDMIGLLLKIKPLAKTTYSTFRFPISLERSEFRNDRIGYESSIRYRFSPSIEREKISSAFSFYFFSDIYFDDFKDNFDSLDMLVNNSLCEVTMNTTLANIKTSFLLYQERLLGETKRKMNSQMESLTRISVKVKEVIDSRTIFRFTKELDRYVERDLTGSELSLNTSLVFPVNKMISIFPGIIIEQRWSDFFENDILQYLWYGSSSQEPFLGLNFRHKETEAILKSSFRNEKVGDLYKSTHNDDNRSLRLEGNFSLSIFNRLSVMLFIDYQYRIYAPYNYYDRRSENISMSFSLSSQL